MMNQLTVMLNGNGQGPGAASHQPSGPGQPHSSQSGAPPPQFFIQGGQLQGTTLTLPDAQMLQLQQGQTTLMVPHSAAAGFAQSQQVQYILTPQQQQQPPQLPQPGQIMANAVQTQQFGLMPNLMGVNVIQPQTQLMAAGQLQPTFMTMTNQPQLQLQTSSAPTLFHQHSQQFHMQNSGSSAILSNSPLTPNLTLSAQPTTQFILNQAVTPQQPSNAQQQQVYQLVLPNGQVIQTLQQPMMAMQPQQQQQTITVPLQQPGQVNQTILAPATLTTFLAPNTPQHQQQLQLITSPPQPPPPQPSPISAMFNQAQPCQPPHSSNILGAIQQQPQGLVITASPMHGHATCSAPGQMLSSQPQSNSTTTTNANPSSNPTTMMVLTSPIGANNTSTSSLIPPTVLDHKTIKTDQRINGDKVANPQSIVAVVTPAPESKPINDVAKTNVTASLYKESSESAKPKPPPSDGVKETKSFGQQTSFELPEELLRNIDVSAQEVTVHKARPNSAASSCASLKIDDEQQDERMDEETEVETEPEADTPSPPVDKCKDSSTSPLSVVAEVVNEKNVPIEMDKEGYQSSYGGSPCHFTDTEDEEEEEEEDDETVDSGEIKLTKRRRLTQAAYNLINNRILSSDQEDNATNQSIDSKCSVTSQEVCDYNSNSSSNNNNSNNNCTSGSSENGEKVSIQIQTSTTPSPASVISNSSCQAEPESTTMNTLFPNGKEKTILNSESCVVDGVNVDEIRDFAKSFKLCRLALGLTQSQVGLELSALNGPCYSQSAICRFEKLDITPKSAKKIKPVLENWMRDAQEKYKNNKLRANGVLSDGTVGAGGGGGGGVCSPSSDTESGVYRVNSAHHPPLHHHKGSPSETISSMHHIESGKKRKRRTSFQPQALEMLNQFFKENPHPSGSEMTKMAQILGYQRDVVRVWFCNKRQTLRNKNQMPPANMCDAHHKQSGSPTPSTTSTITTSTTGPQKLSDLTKKDEKSHVCSSSTSSNHCASSQQSISSLAPTSTQQQYPAHFAVAGNKPSKLPSVMSVNGAGSAFKPVMPPNYGATPPPPLPPPAVFTPVAMQAIKSAITAPQLAPTFTSYTTTPLAIATKSSGHAITPSHCSAISSDHSHPITSTSTSTTNPL